MAANDAYLKLNRSLGSVLFTSTSGSNLLRFRDLASNGLESSSQSPKSSIMVAYCGDCTSMLKSSKAYPSTALMLSFEFGCTTAKPPDTLFE